MPRRYLNKGDMADLQKHLAMTMDMLRSGIHDKQLAVMQDAQSYNLTDRVAVELILQLAAVDKAVERTICAQINRIADAG